MMWKWLALVGLVALLNGMPARADNSGKDPKADPKVQEPDYLPGLVAHYYRDPEAWNGTWPENGPAPHVDASGWTFSRYQYTRVEPLINHFFIRRGWFSVRWQGWFDSDSGHSAANGKNEDPTTCRFLLWADDGCRLSVDGKVLIDSWIPCAETTRESRRQTTVDLAPGKHRVVVEYFQGQSLLQHDRDPIKLYWAHGTGHVAPQTIVPAAHFFHTLADLEPQRGRLDAGPVTTQPAAD